MNFPPDETASLIEALRDELQEYGALLHLLKDQQQQLVSRQAEEVLHLSGSIEAQLPVVNRVRQRRQQEMLTLAGSAAAQDGPAGIKLCDLLPFFPATISPMIRGLVEEINRLVSTVARFARQNQMLLVRAVESTQAALRSVQPTAAQKTYSATGRLYMNLPQIYEGGNRCVA